MHTRLVVQEACYLIYSEESGGTLLENWNEDPVAEALAFFIPGMVMSRFDNTGLRIPNF